MQSDIQSLLIENVTLFGKQLYERFKSGEWNSKPCTIDDLVEIIQLEFTKFKNDFLYKYDLRSVSDKDYVQKQATTEAKRILMLMYNYGHKIESSSAEIPKAIHLPHDFEGNFTSHDGM